MQTNCVPFDIHIPLTIYFWGKLFFHFLYYIPTCILSYISYLFLREKNLKIYSFIFYTLLHILFYTNFQENIYSFSIQYPYRYTLLHITSIREKKIVWNIFFHFLYHITYYIYPMPISWKISLLQMYMWISSLHIWCKSWRTSFTYLLIISFI